MSHQFIEVQLRPGYVKKQVDSAVSAVEPIRALIDSAEDITTPDVFPLSPDEVGDMPQKFNVVHLQPAYDIDEVQRYFTSLAIDMEQKVNSGILEAQRRAAEEEAQRLEEEARRRREEEARVAAEEEAKRLEEEARREEMERAAVAEQEAMNSHLEAPMGADGTNNPSEEQGDTGIEWDVWETDGGAPANHTTASATTGDTHPSDTSDSSVVAEEETVEPATVVNPVDSETTSDQEVSGGEVSVVFPVNGLLTLEFLANLNYLSTTHPQAPLYVEGYPITGVTFHDEGTLLTAGSSDGEMTVSDILDVWGHGGSGVLPIAVDVDGSVMPVSGVTVCGELVVIR